jgi:hypothetical protein
VVSVALLVLFFFFFLVVVVLLLDWSVPVPVLELMLPLWSLVVPEPVELELGWLVVD